MSNLRDATRVPTTAQEKERRAQDAAQAMRQYEEQKLAVLANTARLRALRLEKEAVTLEQENEVVETEVAAKPAKKVKKRA
jgi:hypothetical protein